MDNNEEITRKIKDKVISCGIELEGINAEGGPGQHEINFRYCNLLENCDYNIYFKQCLKHLMHKEGMGCTFMAKPFAEHPGSSFHIHLSLYDENGFIIFSKRCKINLGGSKSINCSSSLLYVIG